ncbi:MAG: hypothetical protein ABIS50_11325 [Luteolibacter sp.]|uniref:hypothetical protein n=1 Tax=Luteolibacter sp. TaxID=1962973 RepID=UPI003266C8CC
MKKGTISPRRLEARAVIRKVIDDNVFGPVESLPREDVLELRVKLREAYPFMWKHGWRLKLWREEIRIALGHPPNKARVRKPKPKHYNDRNVMPSMREWARQRGLIQDEPEVTDE